jgi:hypothetical protein
MCDGLAGKPSDKTHERNKTWKLDEMDGTKSSMMQTNSSL